MRIKFHKNIKNDFDILSKQLKMENWPSYIRDLARTNGYNLFFGEEPFNWNGLYKDLKKYIFRYLDERELKLVSKEFYTLYWSKFSQEIIEKNIIKSYKAYKSYTNYGLGTLIYLTPLYRLENKKIEEIKMVTEDSILKKYNILCFCDSMICNCYIYDLYKDIGEDFLYLENYCFEKKLRLNDKIIRIFLKYRKDIDWIEKFNLNINYHFTNYMSDISQENIYLLIRKYFSNDYNIIVSALSHLYKDSSKKYREKIYELIDNKIVFLREYNQKKRNFTIIEEIIKSIETKVDISEFDFSIRKVFMNKNIKCVNLESADAFYLMFLDLIPFNFQIFIEELKKANIDLYEYSFFVLRKCSVEDISYFLEKDYEFTGSFLYDFLSILEERFPYKYLEISTELIIKFLNYTQDYQGKYFFLKLKNLVDIEKIYDIIKKERFIFILEQIFRETHYNTKIRYLIGKDLSQIEKVSFSLDFLHEIIKDNNTEALQDLFLCHKRRDLQKLMIDKLNEIYSSQ